MTNTAAPLLARFPLPSHTGDRRAFASGRDQGCSFERHHELRLDEGKLVIEPPPENLDLTGVRPSMQVALAAHLAYGIDDVCERGA